jgi:hypothetical protein
VAGQENGEMEKLRRDGTLRVVINAITDLSPRYGSYVLGAPSAFLHNLFDVTVSLGLDRLSVEAYDNRSATWLNLEPNLSRGS